MSRCDMPTDSTQDSPSEFRLAGSETTTEVTTPIWPFAPSRTPESADEQAEHAEDLLNERPELSGYDAVVDASFPASDPPPGPTHIGGRK